MMMRPLRVLERRPRFMRRYGYLRGGLRIAPLLRDEMAERSLNARQLSEAVQRWARADGESRKALDTRTIQHAMEGSCELDTWLMLGGYFGWDLVEALHTPIIGATPVEALLARRDALLADAHALTVAIDRRRTAETARATT